MGEMEGQCWGCDCAQTWRQARETQKRDGRCGSGRQCNAQGTLHQCVAYIASALHTTHICFLVTDASSNTRRWPLWMEPTLLIRLTGESQCQRKPGCCRPAFSWVSFPTNSADKPVLVGANSSRLERPCALAAWQAGAARDQTLLWSTCVATKSPLLHGYMASLPLNSVCMTTHGCLASGRSHSPHLLAVFSIKP
jgi:hypothetical protein